MTKSTPPGPAGLPLLGSVFPWLRNQPRFLLETYRRYGEVVRFELLGFHGAILHGAAANRYILIDAVDNFQVGMVIDVASEMDDLALIIEGRTLFSLDLSGTEHALSDAVTVVTQTMNDAFRIAFAQFPFDIPGIGYGRSVRRAIALIRATL